MISIIEYKHFKFVLCFQLYIDPCLWRKCVFILIEINVKVRCIFAYTSKIFGNIHWILHFKFKCMLQVDEKIQSRVMNLNNEIASLNLDQSLTQSPFIYFHQNLDILHFILSIILFQTYSNYISFCVRIM